MYIVQDTSQSLALYLSTLNIAAVLVDPSSPPKGKENILVPSSCKHWRLLKWTNYKKWLGRRGGSGTGQCTMCLGTKMVQRRQLDWLSTYVHSRTDAWWLFTEVSLSHFLVMGGDWSPDKKRSLAKMSLDVLLVSKCDPVKKAALCLELDGDSHGQDRVPKRKRNRGAKDGDEYSSWDRDEMKGDFLEACGFRFLRLQGKGDKQQMDAAWKLVLDAEL